MKTAEYNGSCKYPEKEVKRVLSGQGEFEEGIMVRAGGIHSFLTMVTNQKEANL